MAIKRKRRTKPKPAPLARVVVRTSSGMITEVEAPKSVEVVVYDYDVEVYHPDQMEEDENGELCVKLQF